MTQAKFHAGARVGQKGMEAESQGREQVFSHIRSEMSVFFELLRPLQLKTQTLNAFREKRAAKLKKHIKKRAVAKSSHRKRR
jgi:hypothetical protein